ncbi:MAG: TonB-dependent receptor [Gammaproteobacteria bacterium]|nr:TonB-dependent receptor [Gammaproteobacteria bacterium]MDE2250945.1 TonB-dependent receptor [Gammaproteobacteria bacterium]
MRRWWYPALALAALAPQCAQAQRADENAVTAADDAFGTKVGSQSIGLYDSEHVRGFSPRAAGNLRIEGLYFDQQTYGANHCLVVEETVRVGLAAQFFDTPSPTGIANYTLHAAGPADGASLLLVRGPFLTAGFDVDAQRVSRGGALGIGLCFHARSNMDLDLARRSHGHSAGVVTNWHPTPRMEMIAFWGENSGDEHDVLPTVYVNGVDRPPEFDQLRLPAQRWATWTWHELTAGAILRSTGSGVWSWAGGVFHSQERDPVVFNDLFGAVDANRTVLHDMDITPPQHARSTSGEIRLLHRTRTDTQARLWSVALRGRSLARGFGGDFLCEYSSLGICGANPNGDRSSIDVHQALAEPDYSFTRGSEDHVHQLGLGVSFEQRWNGRGSFSVGAQRVDYRRSISAPNGAATSTTQSHSTPVLTSLRFTVEPSAKLVAYGGYTRGLEDSAPAPTNAAVPFATAPATATWQADAGVRYTPRKGTQLVAGVFQIQKAYFNLDGGGHYRQLGHLRNRGIEASATITGDDGLTSVLGAVWLRPSLLVDPGQAAAPDGVVLGVIPLLLDANFDYAPKRWGPWSGGAQLQRVSARPAGPQDLPSYWLVALTARYRTAVFGRTCVLRLDADDLNNAMDLQINSSGIALPELGRRLALTVTVDL